LSIGPALVTATILFCIASNSPAARAARIIPGGKS
jgi:hypothetical protein